MILERMKAIHRAGYLYGWLGTGTKPEDKEYELMYKNGQWMFKKREAITWYIITNRPETILETLEHAQVDLYQLNLLLMEAILTNATHVYMEAIRLTSKDAVHRAYKDWAAFGESLVKVVNKTLNKSKLEVIEGGKDGG